MTREEAIAYGKDYLRDLVSAVCEISEKHKEFVRMSIKALEQEPILDKIRAEIEQIADEEQKHDKKWAIGLRYAVKIIDKYKAEK